jgi:pteridine reductase
MQEQSSEAKVALITGAARRIGAAIARQLHAAGMRVILHYNASEEEALSLCEELNQLRPSSARALRADLQMANSAQALVQKAADSWSRLDVLVNNASRFYKTSIGKVTEYAWDDLLTSNLKIPFFLAQAAAPFLAATKGSIINITDMRAERPMRDYSVYCISKAGLVMLTKALAKELGPLIRVNAVAPGAILWPEGDNALTAQDKQKIIEQTLLKRSGYPDDVAKTVLFFVAEGTYITGQVLIVDGGRMLSV